VAEQLVNGLGLAGLFVAALLAASLLPFPVEAVVPLMMARGYSPVWIVLVGTSGGYVGSLVNYRLASKGEQWWRQRHPKRSGLLDRVDAVFTRRGSPVLVLSWLPIVGELITVAGGLARVPLRTFSFWTILGRAIRMTALVGLSNVVL
jgi:membrane protein YqaA with SNARE-associated domain